LLRTNSLELRSKARLLQRTGEKRERKKKEEVKIDFTITNTVNCFGFQNHYLGNLGRDL